MANVTAIPFFVQLCDTYYHSENKILRLNWFEPAFRTEQNFWFTFDARFAKTFFEGEPDRTENASQNFRLGSSNIKSARSGERKKHRKITEPNDILSWIFRFGDVSQEVGIWQNWLEEYCRKMWSKDNVRELFLRNRSNRSKARKIKTNYNFTSILLAGTSRSTLTTRRQSD